jgi:hypothetical protein
MNKRKSDKNPAKTTKRRDKKTKAVDETKTLTDKLSAAVKDLLYISETDAPFEPFVWKRDAGADAFSEPTADAVLRFTGNAPDAPVQEQSEQDFFRVPTTDQDWFGEEEKATAQRFRDLQTLLDNSLKNIKVFKIGKANLDVYIVGVDSDGNLAGLKTQAVET